MRVVLRTVLVNMCKTSAWHSHCSRSVGVNNRRHLFSLYLMTGTVLALLWDVVWFSQQLSKVSVIIGRPRELGALCLRLYPLWWQRWDWPYSFFLQTRAPGGLWNAPTGSPGRAQLQMARTVLDPLTGRGGRSLKPFPSSGCGWPSARGPACPRDQPRPVVEGSG